MIRRLNKKANLSKEAYYKDLIVTVKRSDIDDDGVDIELPVDNIEEVLTDELFDGNADEYDDRLVYVSSAKDFDLGDYYIEEANELAQLYEDLSKDEQLIVVSLFDNAVNFDSALDIVLNNKCRIIDGTGDSDIAYDYINNMGGIAELDREILESYFDYTAFGKDLRVSSRTDYIKCDNDDVTIVVED